MATREAIALMRDNALHHLLNAADTISAARDIAPPSMPERNRDPDYQHAAELTAVADWAERVATAVSAEPTDEGDTPPESEAIPPTPEPELVTERNPHVAKTTNARSGR